MKIKESSKNDITGNGFENGKSYIDSTFSPFTVAIQDDFSYWDACGESDESGKVFMVDTEKKKNRNFNSDTESDKTSGKSEVASNSATYIQLFFDDNVERFRSHIVDVRTASTFEPIPFKLSENIFVKKVETYFAITDENYFIDLVEEMVSAQISYIQNFD